MCSISPERNRAWICGVCRTRSMTTLASHRRKAWSAHQALISSFEKASRYVAHDALRVILVPLLL